MAKIIIIGTCTALALLSGCGTPDTKALKKLACEQVSNTIDLQSVNQLDALRKALRLAPEVDPIESCRALGATMGAGPQEGKAATRTDHSGGITAPLKARH